MEAETPAILFVDDDAKYRRLLSSIVADLGFEICQAGSAEEALAVLAGKRFSLMVTDLQMPGLDGVELAVRARRLDPAMARVIVTGAISEQVLGRAQAAGIARVLPKPSRIGEVMELVRGMNMAGCVTAGIAVREPGCCARGR